MRLSIRGSEYHTEMLAQDGDLMQGLLEGSLLEKRLCRHLGINELDVPEETVRRVLGWRFGVAPILHV
jgi:hypothetical protein